ncbi:hypothetical protein [Brunnivagina elsteri]|uniref:Uncharacterized protein n=1 Tax=Brunnivagina elsteri CCALA 953 TaxID=987040 RepID=A0A2A2TM97_9CYAN|nr:hypothetical protein [Calothrix elsteri]PAX59544.1 hypothetical protein CK510_06530 [Calothrix elsteri CCALA 953]
MLLRFGVRDRKEQRDSLAIPSGFGTAGIIVSVLQIEEVRQKTALSSLSVTLGVVVGLLVWLIS